MSESPPSPTYLTGCWNCLGEFDALSAIWCSDDPKNPTKLCPFCLHCSCHASEAYKQEFWRRAPQRLHDDLQTLSENKDRLGDILIRMGKLTTPQLLDALVEQKNTGRRLGEILTGRGLVSADEIAAALRNQGLRPLTDSQGATYASTAVWEKSDPNETIQNILGLAARKGASDVHIEPREDMVSVRYRIDGSFFRVDPIPKAFQPVLTRKIFEVFGLDPARAQTPQTSRTFLRLADADYELGGPGAAHRPRRQRLHQARQPHHLSQGLHDAGPGAGGPRPAHGAAAQPVRPGAGHGAAVQRSQHHHLLDHELPGPGPARPRLPRVARVLAA
jgi:hypothetical protein